MIDDRSITQMRTRNINNKDVAILIAQYLLVKKQLEDVKIENRALKTLKELESKRYKREIQKQKKQIAMNNKRS